ncbi:MAG: hypothetical protein ACREAB_03225 [Blastocatellia bacterium]
MEAFWRQCDPHPTTVENEYCNEHYAHLAFANQTLCV